MRGWTIRHENLDQQDGEMVDALRAEGAIGISSRVGFALPWHLLARTVEEIPIRLT